jgi:hypothetical protein
MPPNILAPKIQLYHGPLSTTKHYKNTRTDILLRICRPPSLPYVLLLSLNSPSCGLSLCAWEKEKRKAGVLLGQWRSWPLAKRKVPCGLSLCAWEKEKRKAGVLLGQWRSWPLAKRKVRCKL